MKFPHQPNPASSIPCHASHVSLRALSRRNLSRLAVGSALTLTLTGCLFPTTHAVRKVSVMPNVQTATVDQLLNQLSTEFNAIKSLTATVDISATTGGEHQGEVKEIPTFAGYIVLRKPSDLHILMLVPYVRSRALEMVSDGKNFKLYIPPQEQGRHRQGRAHYQLPQRLREPPPLYHPRRSSRPSHPAR